MPHPSIDGVELTASCRKTDGSFEDASISIDGISNENGTLPDRDRVRISKAGSPGAARFS